MARLLRLLLWPIGLGALVGLFLLAQAINERIRRDSAAEASATAETPRRANRGVVKLGVKLAEAHRIADEPAREVAWSPGKTVHGRVIPNPRATLELRSPFAGILRETTGHAWPTVGQWVAGRQELGRLDVRVSPLERLELQARLNEARRKEQGASEAVEIHQNRVERLRKLASPEIVSRRELDDALIALAEAKAQLEIARGAGDLWQKALRTLERSGETSTAWAETLTTPAEGEVTEATIRPGGAVEAGGVLLRLVDFRRPLIRLDVPADLLEGGPRPQVAVVADSPPLQPPFGGAPRLPSSLPSPIPATLVGPAPQLDANSPYSAYLYEARLDRPGGKGASWRPGLFVRAEWQVPGAKPEPAVSVPLDALLYHQGRALVYVRIGPGRYERREVHVLGRQDGRWVLASGVAVDEPVVSRQAQVLLSEEFRGDVDDD